MSSSIDMVGSSGVPSYLGASSQGETNGSMSHMMQQLGNALVQFQMIVMSVEQRNSQSRFQISDTVLKVIKTVTDDFIQAMEKLAAAENEQKSLSGIQKILSYVMDGLMIVSSIMTQQWGMVAMMMTTTALSASGAIKDIEDDISKDLQKNQHMSKDEANFVADTITAVVIIAVALLVVGAARASSALRDVSSTVEAQVGARASMSAAEDGDEEITEINPPATEQPEPEAAPKAADEAPAAAKKPGWTSPVLLAVTQGISSTDFASSSATYAARNTSEKNKWKVELTVELIIGVLTAVAGVAAMKNLSASTKALESTAVKAVGSSKGFSGLLRQASNLLESLSSSTAGVKLFKGANMATNAALLAQAGSSGAQGVNSIQLGNQTLASALAQSENEQYKGLLKLSQTNFSNYLNEANNELRGVNMIMNEIGTDFTAVNAEEARSFH